MAQPPNPAVIAQGLRAYVGQRGIVEKLGLHPPVRPMASGARPLKDPGPAQALYPNLPSAKETTR